MPWAGCDGWTEPAQYVRVTVLPCGMSPGGALCWTTIEPVHVDVGFGMTFSTLAARAAFAVSNGCCETSGKLHFTVGDRHVHDRPLRVEAADCGVRGHDVPSGTSGE